MAVALPVGGGHPCAQVSAAGRSYWAIMGLFWVSKPSPAWARVFSVGSALVSTWPGSAPSRTLGWSLEGSGTGGPRQRWLLQQLKSRRCWVALPCGVLVPRRLASQDGGCHPAAVRVQLPLS